jgi:uncharacterized protein YijF (DUF1287 family)
MRRPLLSLLAAVAIATVACERRAEALRQEPDAGGPPVAARVVASAVGQVGVTRTYDPVYVRIPYPGGDVPADRGVCSDVVVRAFRAVGVDLQKEVHEDMRANFRAYPKRWGLKRPDPNIDHRRVANLMTFFERKGKSLPVTSDPARYRPGDVVAWELDTGQLHIGIVTDLGVEGSPNRAVAHNIGSGAQVEDVLFSWRVIGHYRYF